MQTIILRKRVMWDAQSYCKGGNLCPETEISHHLLNDTGCQTGFISLRHSTIQRIQDCLSQGAEEANVEFKTKRDAAAVIYHL